MPKIAGWLFAGFVVAAILAFVIAALFGMSQVMPVS